MRDDFGPLFRLPAMLGRKDLLMSFAPEDFAKLYRTEGAWPLRNGFETLAYYRRNVRPEIFADAEGVVTAQGEAWYKMRTIANPIMMQPKTVRVYVGDVDEIAREFTTIMCKIRDDKYELPADFIRWMNRWALETMGVLALESRLGVLQSTDSGEGQKLLETVDQILKLTYQLEILPSLWRYFKTPAFRKLMAKYDDLTDLVMAKIEEAIVKFEQNPSTEGNQSVLEKMLKIDKHTAVTMALDMIFGGIEMTSACTAGTLYCLATHPEKQAKLRDELRTILPNKDSIMTADSMRNLPYLRACIKEGLRMIPPTVGSTRATGRDIVLQGYRVPKGMDVIMCSMVLLREEQYFGRIKEFLPERWLSGQQAEIPSAKETHPFLLLPFGFGSRSCVGKRLAMMEMEVALARIVRQFEVRWNYGEYKQRATVINLPDVPLRFEMKDVVD
uniref:Uncharacterized protein n=1 Tax=Anopheles farauti TaxID=69004 RepID=A0A182QZP4_9DIPT